MKIYIIVGNDWESNDVIEIYYNLTKANTRLIELNKENKLKERYHYGYELEEHEIKDAV